MTNQELLELAAKACGMTANEAMGKIGKSISLYSKWAPLTDDGDALRLATYLRFTIKIAEHAVEIFDMDGECLVSIPMFAQDIENASGTARRAIVLAAANISKLNKLEGELDAFNRDY